MSDSKFDLPPPQDDPVEEVAQQVEQISNAPPQPPELPQPEPLPEPKVTDDKPFDWRSNYCSFRESWLQQVKKNRQCRHNLPLQITNAKNEYILQKGTVNQRHIGLCIGSLSVALLSMRFQPQFTRVLRNTVATYYVGGVFVVPEIFNPFLIFRYNN